MAVTVYVRDLENYPDVQKSISVNLSQLIPVGQAGDEKWTVSLTTSAYSNNTNRTAISDIYITDTKRGWVKSSGLINAPITLDGSKYKLKVKIDNVATGTYEVTLATGTNLTGEAIAEDIQDKLRAEADAGGGQQNNLSYMAASCEWKDNKFWIYSGTVDNTFGSAGTSVVIEAASGNDAKEELGFDLGISSYWLTSNPSIVVATTSQTSAGADHVDVNSGLGVSVGDAFKITDGSNSEFFLADTGSSETTISATLFSGGTFANTYATGSKVVRLEEGDPDNPAVSSFENIDAAVRWGLTSLIEQIDFSS